MSESATITRRKYDEKTMYQNLFAEDYKQAEPINVQVTAPAQQTQQRPALARKPYSSMSKKEQEAEKQKHQEMKASNTFVTAEDMQQPYIQHLLEDTKRINGEKLSGQDMINKALEGDCSFLEKMDPVLRNRAATLYMAKFVKEYGENTSPLGIIEAMRAKQDPVSEMLNPLLRAGISLFIHSPIAAPEVVDKYRELDSLLNKEIMVATNTKRASTVPEGFTVKQKHDNMRSQQFIIKSLLACHIGQLTEKNVDKNQAAHKWHGPVANAFAHCSRVMFILPGTTDYSETQTLENIDSWVKLAPFKTRGGATHNLQLKRRDGTVEAKEKKSFTPFHQKGMNVAVGGLGNAGIPGPKGARRLLRNDGSCGHLYMHLEKGDKEKNSGMLLGLESDAFMVRNQQGHRHDIFATAEKASSFGGQRVDEIGDKYGGREVDLSKVNEQGFTKVMDFVDELTQHLLQSNDQQSIEALDDLARDLSGNLMDAQAMQDFFDRLKRMAEEFVMMNDYNVDFMDLLYGNH